MRSKAGLLSLLLTVLLVSACAVAEIAKTSPPPLTLGPGPVIVTAGSCEKTSDLETWAEAAYFQTTDFVQSFNAAVGKKREDVFNDVLHLNDIRTDMISRPTPDCALETQKVLADGMEKATRALQAYANGDLTDLTSLLPDLNARLQQAVNMENDLIDRLKTQYPPRATATSVGVPAGG